jgi:DNA-binding CsgD family transcriptional regulator
VPGAMAEPSLLGRDAELRELERTLDALERRPAALVLQGEPGIGRTALVRAAARRAGERGMRVLSCAGAAAEAALPWVALADLLGGVAHERLAALPARERAALDAVLLRAGAPPAGPDPRVVATAVRALVAQLARERPLLLAIDDAQWLDRASAGALARCARGLDGRAGLVLAWRAGDAHAAPPPAGPATTAAPPLADWRRVRVLRLNALDPAALHALLRRHAPPAHNRRALARVAAAADGNPGVALALLRALPAHAPPPPPGAPLPLPSALRARVAARLDGVAADAQLRELLLAVACLDGAAPALLARALGPGAPACATRAVALGLLRREGAQLRVASGLLAEGVLAQAGPSARRAMHRHLGALADGERRARQLALGAVLPDALEALIGAARDARARGAPDTAAELVELALALEPDDADALRVRAAEHHLDAGDAERAQALLDAAIARLPAGERRAEALVLAAELALREAELTAARALLERAHAEAAAGSPLRVAAGVRLAVVLGDLGLTQDAATAAADALAAAERLAPAVPGLLAQALAVAAAAGFALGAGIDEPRLRRALALEDPALRTPVQLRPAFVAATVLARAGQLDEATALLRRLRGERGQRDELGWIGARLAWCEQLRGDLAAAHEALAHAERGRPAHAPPPATARLLALTARARLAAQAGRAAAARAAAQEALALAAERGWRSAVTAQHATLGALELSEGDAAAAVARLEPLAAVALADGLPEPAAGIGPLLADAAEALVLVGRGADAEPLVALLERRGAALDRMPALAAGARCRALLLAASGELAGAERTLRRAPAAHAGHVPALERARCLLALGRVTRRLRRRAAAARTFEQALAGFEAAGAQLWAARARDELAALGSRTRGGGRARGASAPDGLTAAEARVARLAASGLTNRQVASALQISAKTVDSHLGRVYRKLEIHSRAELGARLGSAPTAGARPGPGLTAGAQIAPARARPAPVVRRRPSPR